MRTGRIRIEISGAVQGMGFRPFVCRLARDLRLSGWVANSRQGVCIEAEGKAETLAAFVDRIESEKPARAVIDRVQTTWQNPAGDAQFEIRGSQARGMLTAVAPPDVAVCARCVDELFDPSNRRYRYPFTHCAECGPRYSVLEAMPYDRGNTTMRRFPMCAACQAEYGNPLDRRFHSELNACPDCGPAVALWDNLGQPLRRDFSAIQCAADALAQGKVVAVKGLGGFHLMTDARNEAAVQRLRRGKRREEKPFALMFPSLAAVGEQCCVSELEAGLLSSCEAPIVLVPRGRNSSSGIAAGVAPENPDLGVMLPYTPLHHLLMAEVGFPVVATSGNRSGEPICIADEEALHKLSEAADFFLVHDRPIVRPVDDSVARVVCERVQLLRRGRGYAPMPVAAWDRPARSGRIAALGAQQKNAVAFTAGNSICLSQHIGDLESAGACSAFEKTVAAVGMLSGSPPEAFACDAHSGYASTEFALRSGLPMIRVQHHHAHVLSCVAEHGLSGPVLGIAWDGTGDGLDGTIWGGEFLRVDGSGYRRVAHLRPFTLPGGDRAIREPRRSALGLLFEILGQRLLEATDLAPLQSFTVKQRATLLGMLSRKLNCPATSSAGRLFDAFASLLGLRQVSSFEGQAACDFEYAAGGLLSEECYPFTLLPSQTGSRPAKLDWEPMLHRVLQDIRAEVPRNLISARVHATFATMMVEAAEFAGEQQVVLTGGCFQNKLLTEMAVHRLRQRGFQAYIHQAVPPNDGGIAAGQLVAALSAARDGDGHVPCGTR